MSLAERFADLEAAPRGRFVIRGRAASGSAIASAWQCARQLDKGPLLYPGPLGQVWA